jgi:hypothetical protein
MRRADPASQSREAYWSMMPVGTPTKSFSAFWQRIARSFFERSSPKSVSRARAVAASIAALDESPEPSGTSPAKAARNAVTSAPFCPIAQTTPRG